MAFCQAGGYPQLGQPPQSPSPNWARPCPWVLGGGAPAEEPPVSGVHNAPSLPEPVSRLQLLAPPAHHCSLTSKAQVAEGLPSSAWHESGRWWETQAGICFWSIVAALQLGGETGNLYSDSELHPLDAS